MIEQTNIFLREIPEIWNRVSFNGDHSGYITTSITKKDYGFHITRFSNYISTQSIKLEIYKDGFAKATVKVDTNYRPKYQYTLYFDQNLIPINKESTRKELIVWKKLRNKVI